MTAAALRLAEDLKNEVSQAGVDSTGIWTTRQHLQDLYQEILLLDLEYALEKNVYQDLWNHAFKNQITLMQSQVKDKKNPKRLQIRASLTLFLEAASGFYLQLLHEICSTFQMQLPGFTPPIHLGLFPSEIGDARKELKKPKHSSCLYICQHCLIHLGDIARYRSNQKQAEIYYQQALALGPSNGHPYNQLAILSQSRFDHLSQIFYYLRSITVKHPFPAASTNLHTTFTKLAESEDNTRQLTKKVSFTEYCKVFCYFHSLIYLLQNVQRAKDAKDCLIANMREFVSSDSSAMYSSLPIRLVFINIFNLWHLTHDSIDKDSASKFSSLSGDEQKLYGIVLDLTVALFAAFLKAIPHNDEDKARNSPFLPAIKIMLDWIVSDSDILEEREFENRKFAWPLLARVLNVIQYSQPLTYANSKPLLEDFELQGFLALRRSLSVLGLPCDQSKVLVGNEALRHRVYRLVELGCKLAQIKPEWLQISSQPVSSARVRFFSSYEIHEDDGEKASRDRIMAKVLSPSSESKQSKAVGTPTKDFAVQAIMKKSNDLSSDDIECTSPSLDANRSVIKKDLSKELTRASSYQLNGSTSLSDSIANSLLAGGGLRTTQENAGSKQRSKNVTFDREPQTIHRTPSPNLDITSEQDFPSLGQNSSIPLISTEPTSEPIKSQRMNQHFQGPRLAINFPGLKTPSANQATRLSAPQQAPFSNQPTHNYRIPIPSTVANSNARSVSVSMHSAGFTTSDGINSNVVPHISGQHLINQMQQASNSAVNPSMPMPNSSMIPQSFAFQSHGMDGQLFPSMNHFPSSFPHSNRQPIGASNRERNDQRPLMDVYTWSTESNSSNISANPPPPSLSQHPFQFPNQLPSVDLMEPRCRVGPFTNPHPNQMGTNFNFGSSVMQSNRSNIQQSTFIGASNNHLSAPNQPVTFPFPPFGDSKSWNNSSVHFNNSAHHLHNQQNPNVTSIWSSPWLAPTGLSPLERLLQQPMNKAPDIHHSEEP